MEKNIKYNTPSLKVIALGTEVRLCLNVSTGEKRVIEESEFDD